MAEVVRGDVGIGVTDPVEMVRARLAAAGHILVALDFDGTLAPFHSDPLAVGMVPGAREVFDAVAHHPGYSLALVSGRPPDELVTLAAPPVGTLLAASHGASRGVATPGGFDVEPLNLTAAETALIAQIERELADIAVTAPNVWVENKPLGRALHTRRADPDVAERATAAAVAGPAGWTGVHALVGKSVVEIAVRSTTKADGVAWARALVAESVGVPVGEVAVLFAGDDTTDEFALEALWPGDVGVKVGDGETAASIRVADEAELVEFLRAVLA